VSSEHSNEAWRNTITKATGILNQAIAAETAERQYLAAALWYRMGQLSTLPPSPSALLLADEASELEYLLLGDTQATSEILDALESEDSDQRRSERIDEARLRLRKSGVLA
jgi:hypothetical protein